MGDFYYALVIASGRSVAAAIVLAVVVGMCAGGVAFAVQASQRSSSEVTADSTLNAVETPVPLEPTLPPQPEGQPIAAVATDQTDDGPAPTATPVPHSALADQIEAAMAAVVPNGSAAFIGPDGRVIARYQGDTPRVAASTIKLPLVLETLRQEAAGTLDLSTLYTVRQEDVVGGTGILQGQVGRTLSLRELVHVAILYSDNVAANVLLDRVGMDNVNASMRNLGFSGTHFERRMLDTVAEQHGKENWTTADDLAGMLEGIANRSLLSPDISDKVLALLGERGSRDLDWIGRGLPDGTDFSHLNGTLDRVRNDAGLVGLGPDQKYVLVVCEDQLADPAAGERAIAELARQVNRLASSSE